MGGCPTRFDLGRSHTRRFDIDVADHHFGALDREPRCASSAHTAGAAGDHSHLALHLRRTALCH